MKSFRIFKSYCRFPIKVLNPDEIVPNLCGGGASYLSVGVSNYHITKSRREEMGRTELAKGDGDNTVGNRRRRSKRWGRRERESPVRVREKMKWVNGNVNFGLKS
ncbi:hypothetical protein DVH24_032135 [Malus domestica]|uniref:Uncharacterized protein n=1 Tax=Malus domestica TaxID=3750 RepID=A0A498J2K5_MALDO|nr:hypothetical protein DVH24_032135 [Malus domestica]